jgi:hypothetical protein
MKTRGLWQAQVREREDVRRGARKGREDVKKGREDARKKREDARKKRGYHECFALKSREKMHS